MSTPFGKLPGGMGNLAQALMEKARKVEADLGNERVEASSGGGAVKAIANGKGELLDLTISPDVVDPNDVEMLQGVGGDGSSRGPGEVDGSTRAADAERPAARL